MDNANHLHTAIMDLPCESPYPDDNCGLYKIGHRDARHAAAELVLSLRTTLQLPVIADGERFAGMMLDADGMPSHYLILLPGDVEMPWQEAMDWAKKIGGDLPTRAEQAQLFANRKSAFEDRYYWSNTQHAGNTACAWMQGFADGYQGGNHRSNSCRARAVRRVVIEVMK